MRAGRVDEGALRRLASYESADAPVLSFYLDLDPSEFALPDARSTAVRSLVDEARRRIEENAGLEHDARRRALEAVERVERWFAGPDFSPQGAQGIGLFCAGDDRLFEVVRLPRPVPSEVVIGRKPFVEPLLDMAAGGRWCVLLASREVSRIFRGSVHALDEVAGIADQPARGQHDQGGWSQRRYQQSVEEDVDNHLKRTSELLHRRFKRAPFERLLVGATRELAPRIEQRLHPELRSRLVGRIDVDVEHSSADDVLTAARPVIEEHERAAEEEALARLPERIAAGRGAGGLDDVLAALTERRVETLLIVEGFSATCSLCPRCGWLGREGVEACPADGTATEPRDDVADLAIDRALAQSAGVLVPNSPGAVAERGGIAAILRF